MKVAAFLAGTALAATLVAGAKADTYAFNVVYGNSGNVSVPGYGTPWTTPITMTRGSETLIVFCDDLNHDFYVGNSYDMTPTLVKMDGLGNALTEQQSNRMGLIADLGRAAYGRGDSAGAIAAQAAIWSVEYDITATSSDSAIEADIGNYLLIQGNANGPWAIGFVPTAGDWPAGGSQAMIVGTPEPATWAMMALGFGGLAAAGWRGRRARALIA